MRNLFALLLSIILAFNAFSQHVWGVEELSSNMTEEDASSRALNLPELSPQDQEPPKKEAEKGMMTSTAERAFFNDLRDRIKDFMNLNVAYMTALERCFSMQENLLKRVRFFDCEFERKKVRETIAIHYPKMRRYLLLHKLLNPNFHRQLADMFRLQIKLLPFGQRAPMVGLPSEDPNPLKDLWRHPIRGFFGGEGVVPDPAFTKDEIRDALFNEDVKIRGTFYPANLNGYEQLYCELAYGKGDAGCAARRLKYADGLGFYYDEMTSEAKAIWSKRQTSKFLQWGTLQKSIRKQEESYNLMKDNFFNIAQNNIYVALASSNNPSPKELAWIFTNMRRNAQDVLAKYEKEMVELTGPNVTNGQLLKLMDYGAVVKSVLKEPGPNMRLMNVDFEVLLEKVNSDYMKDSLKRAGIQVGLLAFANFVVCAATSGLLKYLSAESKIVSAMLELKDKGRFIPFCFAVTSIPITTWFLRDSLLMFDHTYREVFSGDGAHFIREVHALPAAEQSIFWSILLAPVGTKDVLKVFESSKLFLKFSKSFVGHLYQSFRSSDQIYERMFVEAGGLYLNEVKTLTPSEQSVFWSILKAPQKPQDALDLLKENGLFSKFSESFIAHFYRSLQTTRDQIYEKMFVKTSWYEKIFMKFRNVHLKEVEVLTASEQDAFWTIFFTPQSPQDTLDLLKTVGLEAKFSETFINRLKRLMGMYDKIYVKMFEKAGKNYLKEVKALSASQQSVFWSIFSTSQTPQQALDMLKESNLYSKFSDDFLTHLASHF